MVSGDKRLFIESTSIRQMKKSNVLYGGFIAIIILFVAPVCVNYFLYSKSEGKVSTKNATVFTKIYFCL